MDTQELIQEIKKELKRVELADDDAMVSEVMAKLSKCVSGIVGSLKQRREDKGKTRIQLLETIRILRGKK